MMQSVLLCSQISSLIMRAYKVETKKLTLYMQYKNLTTCPMQNCKWSIKILLKF